MRLEGWNHIPKGYGATFGVAEAPTWLRLLHRIPFIDRFSFPLLVRRGLGWLSPDGSIPEDELAPAGGGWRLEPPGHVAPGSVELLSAPDHDENQ